MTARLTYGHADFDAQLSALLDSRNVDAADVSHAVKIIMGDVRDRGDKALIDYTKKFDRLETTELRITEAQMATAEKDCSPEVRAALEVASTRIRAYHEAQKPTNHRYVDDAGVTLGWQYAPLESVGIYVPGGKASYPQACS